jgi:hypothetical protein
MVSFSGKSISFEVNRVNNFTARCDHQACEQCKLTATVEEHQLNFAKLFFIHPLGFYAFLETIGA